LALASGLVWLLGWALVAGALGSMTGSEGDLGVFGVYILVMGFGTLLMVGLGLAAVVVGSLGLRQRAEGERAPSLALVAVVLGVAEVLAAFWSPVGSIAT